MITTTTTTTTATITLVYRLDEAGRKACLLAGGDGRAIQCVNLPLTPELLALACVYPSGSAWLWACGPLDEAEQKLVGAAPPHDHCLTAFYEVTRSRGVRSATDYGSYRYAISAPPADPVAWVLGLPTANAARLAVAEAELARLRQSDRETELAAFAVWLADEARSGDVYDGVPTIWTADGRSVKLYSLTDAERATFDAVMARRQAARDAAEAKAKAERTAREAREAEAKAEADRVAAVEREAWIAAHGSERLKKALALGLLGRSLAVYRDERLALHAPGWEWLDKDTEESEPWNPSESVMDAVLAEQPKLGETYATLRLCRLRDSCSEPLSRPSPGNPWRTALVATFDWSGEREAVLDLDDTDPETDND